MKKSGTLAFALMALLIFCVGVFPSWAIDYPTRPINFLVPYAPGGQTDIQARALAAAMGPHIEQPFVIMNKPGATGTLMMATLAASKPDGYTVAICPGALTITPHLQQVSYDVTKDFTYIVALSNFAESIAVQTEAPWKTLKDLVEYARQNPNKIRIGNAGLASWTVFMAKKIAQKEGIQWTDIPFNSEGEVNTALLGGHIEVGLFSGPHIPNVRAGKFRMLAVGTAQRLKEFPDVPTVKELGYDFVALSYCGILAPKGLPEPIEKKLIESFSKGRKEPAFVEAMEKIALFPAPEVGKEFHQKVVEGYKIVGEFLKK
jgi:tripartite-type tricarboxylate transporter receptor subunit TctC